MSDSRGETGERAPGPDLGAFLNRLREDGSRRPDPHTVLEPLRERMGSVTQALDEIYTSTYEASAADDQVVAIIDGRAKVRWLDISPRAMRDLDASELSAACADAIATARRALAEELEIHIRDIGGVDLQTAAPPEDVRAIWRRAMEAARW